MSRCLWPIKLFGLTALIVSCASKPTGIQPSVTIPESWVRIALPHPSVFPDYSEDGQQLIFVHENIKQHLKPQIYRFDIETKQSTQLSFNSGHNIHPTFVSEKSFAFLSTTDHDKESPRFLRTDQEKDWSFPALLSALELPYHFDVYQMDLAKKHIDRKHGPHSSTYTFRQQKIAVLSHGLKPRGKPLTLWLSEADLNLKKFFLKNHLYLG